MCDFCKIFNYLDLEVFKMGLFCEIFNIFANHAKFNVI